MFLKKYFVIFLILLATLSNTGPSYCATIDSGPNDYFPGLEYNGNNRYFWVHFPANFDMLQSIPIVLVFHGGGGNLFAGHYQTLMNELSDKKGFIVVYPEGNPVDPIKKPHENEYWNDGRQLADGSGYIDVDDVSFVEDILDHLQSRLPVDKNRIYASGISNGALMTFRLANELSDRIAAIGTVAAVRGVDEIQPTPPVAMPVIHFHGRMDPYAPYYGGPSPYSHFITEFLPVTEAMQTWVEHNKCLPEPVETLTINNAVMTRWSGGDADVILWTLEDGGHTWPGGRKFEIEDLYNVGNLNMDISASEKMWEFFNQYRLHKKPTTNRDRARR